MTATQTDPKAGKSGDNRRIAMRRKSRRERVKGQIEAASANVARNQFAVQGMRVHKLTERKGLQVEITKQKVPLVEIMHFSRQMATFLRAGVPMTEAHRQPA